MKTPALLVRRCFAAVLAPLLALVFVSASADAAVGPPPPPPPLPTGPAVEYTPATTKMIEGSQPIINEYLLTIKSPSNVAGQTPVSVDLTVESRPEGVSIATAESFVHFLNPTTRRELTEGLQFERAGESQTILVSVSFPIGAPTGQFKYWITTGGWADGTTDHGTRINAQVSPPLGLPPPTVSIVAPADGANFKRNAATASVPVTITLSAQAAAGTRMLSLVGFVSGVASDGAPLMSETPLALDVSDMNATTATGEVVVPLTNAGTYTIKAVATSTGGTAQATSKFTIELVAVPPPTIAFTLSPKSSYDRTAGAPALQIPFAFKAVSAQGGIRSLSATLDGSPISIVSAGLNSLEATATGSVTVADAKEYVLAIKATDDHGVAIAETSFTVNVITAPGGQPVRGVVFFDVNSNGRMDGDDYGLPGVKVRLVKLFGPDGKTTTDADGEYVFNADPGIYVVWVDRPDGFVPTTLFTHPVLVCKAPVTVSKTGFALGFTEMRTMTADGNSHGYWKTNLQKAVAGKKQGTQVDAATLRRYTEEISTLALEPFDGITMNVAVDALSANSSKPEVLLAKQLLAAEYNYAAGAYIDGSGTLTYAFIYYGERVLDHADSYSRSELTFVKDWFDAYNNSHGGKLLGPKP